MNSMKRISAVLLAVLMAVTLLPGSVFAKVFAKDAETLAFWDFESENPNVKTASANNTGAVVAREDSTIAFSYSGGNGSAKAISSDGWDAASESAPKYYTVTVNTTGYSGITVSAAFRASNTGPKNITLYYSADGDSFTALEGASVALEGTAWG